MRAGVPVALLLVTVLAGSSPALGSPTLAGPVGAEVVRVVDGDTLVVRANIWLGQMIETHVRIEGIDAPELRARCAREKDMAEAARTLAEKLVAGGPVRLFEVRDDKYGGRVRARVQTASGQDFGQAMLAAGLARPYHGERRQPWCHDGEGE